MKQAFFLSLVILFWISSGCKEQTQQTSTVELITVKEMDSLVQLGTVQLIDVRTPKEYDAGHIKGAININFYDKNFGQQIEEVDKSQPIAVYCGSGVRSAKCASMMKKAGFTKIFDLDGGISEWKYNRKPLVKE